MRIVTFGELMLRLCPPGFGRFIDAGSFDASYGGGEANVAVSLASFGADAAFVTRLPDNELGQAAVNSLRRWGVDTSLITRGGERIGIYFLETGASVRPSKVLYDRAHSAVSEAKRGDFDWERVLTGADWFHFTGITPALGGELPLICADALEAAAALGVRVSCDLNYRGRLWDTETARRVMTPLMERVDVCIANEEDADKVFGIRAAGDVGRGELVRESYAQVADELARRFGFSTVAITQRTSLSASDNLWAALLRDENGGIHRSREYKLHLVDRVGGGDSFAAGLIYASLAGKTPGETLEFATAASALKQTIKGDYNLTTIKETEALMLSGGAGRIAR